MKLLISHPTGNQNVRAAAIGLMEADMATSFNTTIASFPGDLLDRLSGVKVFSGLGRRRFDGVLRNITDTWPWLELARQLSLRAGFNSLTKHEHGSFSVDAVYKNLDTRTAKILKGKAANGTTAVYAYEDGALLSFREAHRLGLKCFYDLPIGYWRTARKVLEGEKARWPDWSSTMTSFYDSLEKLKRKDEEIALADVIFTASQFTADTLADYPGRSPSVRVIPYGFPSVAVDRTYHSRFDRPLRILFVGGLSQRKGIAYLFHVAEKLGKHVELTVVGKKTGHECPALDRALTKHLWFPSLPHGDVLDLMRVQDVLVFPSLFEGFGLVISEAMSQGTPVITTERTTGPDLISHGNNGWLIKAGSSDSLQHTLEYIISNRNLVRQVGMAALETARNRPWKVYGRELADAIRLSYSC